MKKFLVLCMLGLLVVASCNNNKQTSSNGEKLDTVWNEKVQDTFYGLRLGDSLDVNTIVATLESHGFWFNEEYSSEDYLHFRSRKSKYFSFGGLGFEMLDIFRDDGILTGVHFMNSSKDKASSLDVYEGIKNTVETKYSPTSIMPNDTTTYAKTYYFGKNNIGAEVACFRYESATNKIWIGTMLSYYILNIPQAPNDEL
nr:hypothetical protein [uncultured Prevotella sp.]